MVPTPKSIQTLLKCFCKIRLMPLFKNRIHNTEPLTVSYTHLSGTLLGKFALISHHLVQIQTSEIPVLCNEKQIEVLNKMLQICLLYTSRCV